MNQIPGLDASFLHLETRQMPMHVGALHNFELPAHYAGDFVAAMRRHMASRLPFAPALRQKVAVMPLNFTNPSWVDAEPDLNEHIVGITLPAGSGQAELERQVGLLHAVVLDRSRPLWKFHVFDGLANGPDGTRRFAMYTQLHHAAFDGKAAVALGQLILDLSPVPRARPAPPDGQGTEVKVRRQLGLVDTLRGALANQFHLVATAVKAIPQTIGALSKMAGQKAGDSAGDAVDAVVARLKGRPARAAARHSVSNLGLAPHTRLNTTLSASRVFASISLPLAQVNAARRRHKATLNDAVLMICSGALRRDFLKHGPLPRKSMVAGVPISTRAKGDTSANTQATMTVVSLGTHIADPAKRLRHVLAATAAMKSNMGAMKNLMPTDFPTLGVPWLMEGLGALYAKARVAERLPAISNLTISNVPGPTVQLYMAGAKMLTNYPTSIVVHGVALNITVQTYNESLEFGIVACGDAMPEVAELARHVQAAFDEFAALPATVEATSTDVPAALVEKVVANQTAPKKATRKATKTTPAKATAVTIVGSSTAASNKATPVRSGRSARKVPARSVSQRTRSAASPATPATPASKVSTPTKKRASR